MAPRRPRRKRTTPAYPLTVIHAVQQVLAYGRVSTDLQRDAETIHIQVTKLEGTIAVRANPDLPLKDQLQLVSSHWDNGISGTVPLEERPAGRKLMEQICPRATVECDGRCRPPGEINQVWITKLDRLARRLQILIDIEAWLRRHNVSLICMDPAIDTSTGTGRLIFTILASIAEWERETILERTTGGKHQKASEGKWVGGKVTLGLKTNEDGHLVVDDTVMDSTGEMAYRMVQSIFENVALHGSTGWQESKRTGLSERRVGLILHNVRYKGEGGIEGEHGWTTAEKHAPPQVVSPELWQMAQDQLISNRRNGAHAAHYPYLLSGLLVCCEPKDDGICGRTFAGRREKRRGYDALYSYYYCSRTLKELPPGYSRGCTAKMLRVVDAEEAVWQTVKRFLANPAKVLAEADSTRGDMLKQLHSELTVTVDQLQRLDTERRNVVRSIEQGWRSQAEGKVRILEVIAQIETVRQQRDAIELQIRGLGMDQLDALRTEVTIDEIATRLDQIEATNDLVTKKTLVQAVVKRIEVRTVDGRATLRARMVYGAETDILLQKLSGHVLASELPSVTVPLFASQNAEVFIKVMLPETHRRPNKGWKDPAA